MCTIPTGFYAKKLFGVEVGISPVKRFHAKVYVTPVRPPSQVNIAAINKN